MTWGLKPKIDLYDLLGCYSPFSFFGGIFSLFVQYNIQHCFICCPSDSTVPTDAGIEPRTVATGALAVRRSNHLARSCHPDHLHGYLPLVSLTVWLPYFLSTWLSGYPSYSLPYRLVIILLFTADCLLKGAQAWDIRDRVNYTEPSHLYRWLED